jgi:hypothetical protein
MVVAYGLVWISHEHSGPLNPGPSWKNVDINGADGRYPDRIQSTGYRIAVDNNDPVQIRLQHISFGVVVSY